MEQLAPILRCPYTGAPVTLAGEHLRAGDRRYPIVDGVPSLVEDGRLSAIDQHFQDQYNDETARRYDAIIRFQSLLIGCRESTERRKMVDLLAARPGSRVLEVAAGTGANLPFLSRAVGPAGEIVAVDLSMAMIRVAQRRARGLGTPVHFVRADACHLPFADATFDAVFHFGGLNMFGDVKAALREMVRVAKPGAVIVAGDEGMSEARRKTWLGRRVGRMNSLNLCRPPFAAVPWDEIQGFQLHWTWRELFYVMRCCKADGPSSEARVEDGAAGQVQSPAADLVAREVRRRATW